MDPNAALQTIRSIVGLHQSEDLSDPLASQEDLVEAVAALDEWLSKGGFLPTDWQR